LISKTFWPAYRRPVFSQRDLKRFFYGLTDELGLDAIELGEICPNELSAELWEYLRPRVELLKQLKREEKSAVEGKDDE
jgi:hypothetical protein